MDTINSKELQKLELNMLVDVANFCDKHGIRYYLCGGTLLGALRYKGFIPWDDDIDIIMPRPDYERFFNEYKSIHSYYIADSIINNPYHWLGPGKIFDKRTVLQNFNEKFVSHVWIDIFPTDGVPRNKLIRFFHFWHTRLINYVYLSTVTTYSGSKHFVDKVDQSQFANLKQKIRTVGKYIFMILFGHIKPSIVLKYMDNQIKRYPIENADEIASQVSCQYFMREIVNRDNFLKQISFNFEGHKFWGPKGYDEYLGHLYGLNYMEPPPIEKRISRHDFIAYWKDEFDK